MREEAGTPGLLSAGDIFAPLPPPCWLVEPLDFAPGAPALLAGYGFSGKTVAAQDLALAVATGTHAWGLLPVHRGRVLHLDYEQGRYLTALRYQRLLRARGIDPREVEGYLSAAILPGWYVDGDLGDRLARLCDGIDLLVLDSFRAACPLTDENSSGARIPLDRLGRISELTGTTVLVVHHSRKPSRDAQGGARMSVRGSGALYDACGSVLVFSGEKGRPVRVEHEKARLSGRTHPDLQLHVEDVEIDGDPRAGLRVTATTVATGAPEAEEAPGHRHEQVKAQVLDLARLEGTLGGKNAIAERLGGRRASVLAAVDELVRTGRLIRGGTKGSPTHSLAGTT